MHALGKWYVKGLENRPGLHPISVSFREGGCIGVSSKRNPFAALISKFGTESWEPGPSR